MSPTPASPRPAFSQRPGARGAQRLESAEAFPGSMPKKARKKSAKKKAYYAGRKERRAKK